MQSPEFLKWIAENNELLHHICGKSCRGRYDLVDELHGVCLDYVERIWNRYESTHGASMSTHIYANLKWYLWKYMNRYERNASRNTSLEKKHENVKSSSPVGDLEALDEVQYLMKQADLSPQERYVIIMHDAYDNTFDEISEMTDVSKSTARHWYVQGMAKLREVIGS